MFKQIPNTNQQINFLTKEIIDSESLYKYNGITIELKLKNNKKISKGVDWVRHLINLELEFENKFLDSLEFLKFERIKPHGVSLEYHYVPLFSKPQVVFIGDEEYRLIARFPKYCINGVGEIYDCSGDENIKIPLLGLEHDYNRVSIIDSLKNKKFIGIHRLIGMSWVHNDDYYKNNIIDHDDKNKRNNFYKNLSWVSSPVNVAKDRMNYGINKFVLKELGNEVEIYCDTLYEASEIIGRSKMDLSYGKLRFGKVWIGKNGKFEMYENTKDHKWYYISKSNLGNNFLVIKNGLRYYFNNLDKLYKFLEVDMASYTFYQMVEYVNSNYKNTKIYYSTPLANSIPREVKNIETKEIFLCKNWREVQNITGINKGSIIKYLFLGIDNVVLNKKWILRYMSKKAWADDENKLETVPDIRRPVLLKDELGEVKFDYPSVNNAATEIKTSERTIVKKILLNKKILKDGLLYYITYK